MKSIITQLKKNQFIGAIGLLGIVAFLGYLSFAHAATNDVTGYACSTNIGCISLNNQTSANSADFSGQPASFAVQFNTSSGEFSGTGWSPRIGDVTFGVPCTAEILTAQGASAQGNKCARVPLVSGSASLQNGGWNGYIYLGGVALASDGIHFSGRGWDGVDTNNDGASPADTGIGWLDFTAIYNPNQNAPSVTLITTTPTVVTSGTGVLQWTTLNVSTCSATSSPSSTPWDSQGSSALAIASGTISIPNMTQTTNFTITCQDSNGISASASVTIDVQPICNPSDPNAWCYNFCQQNPTDSICVCNPSDPNAWCYAFCQNNPTDPSCVGGKLKPQFIEN